MIESQFNAMRGESYISRIECVNRQHYETVLNKQFTRKSLTEWLNVAREPWRGYFPYRPDDMPPKGGNPAALAKLEEELSAWNVDWVVVHTEQLPEELK